EGGDFVVLDAVLEVRAQPIFHAGRDVLATIDERDPCSVTPEIQGGFGSRVLATNDNHVTVVVGIRFLVVMQNLGQIFARNLKLVRQIVVAGGDNHFSRTIVVDFSGTIRRSDTEVSVLASDGLYPLILDHVQMIVVCNAPVVLERFLPRRLLAGAGKGDVAD